MCGCREMEQDLLHVKGQKERQAGARALLPVLFTPPLTSDRSLVITVFFKLETLRVA